MAVAKAKRPLPVATSTKFDSCEIGVFSKLTNAYCLIPFEDSENCCRKLEDELGSVIPVVKASIAGRTTIGRLCAGNKNGLLLSHIASREDLICCLFYGMIELQYLRDSLPDSVMVEKVEERLSALGNCISCNDHVALVYPGLHKETKELIADVLGVEVFNWTGASNEEAAGSYAVLSNTGGLVHPHISMEVLNNLSTILGVPLAAGTVNGGRDMIATGLIVNDWIAFCGWNTTPTERSVMEIVLGTRVVPLAMD